MEWRGECTNEWFKGLLKSPKNPCENYSIMLIGYHWLSGDDVMGNESIKLILIRVQVMISRKCTCEKKTLKTE